MEDRQLTSSGDARRARFRAVWIAVGATESISTGRSADADHSDRPMQQSRSLRKASEAVSHLGMAVLHRAILKIGRAPVGAERLSRAWDPAIRLPPRWTCMIDLNAFRNRVPELGRVHHQTVVAGHGSDNAQVAGLAEYWHLTPRCTDDQGSDLVFLTRSEPLLCP